MESLEERRKCKKCGNPKRSVKLALCTECYNNKIFPIWSKHTEEDIEDLIEWTNVWLHTINILQRQHLSLENINDVITIHWNIFHREYCYQKKSFGKQIQLMFRDITKFNLNYRKKDII